MYKKKWFQALVTIVLVFILVLLVSQTKFVFTPVFKYIGAVAVPIIGAGILFYITKPILNLLEKIKIPRVPAILLIFLLVLGLGVLFVFYIAPKAQAQFNNLVDNIPKMVKVSQKYIDDFQSEQIVIPDQVQEAIANFMDNAQNHVENIVSSVFSFITNLITIIASVVMIPFFLFFMLKDSHKFIPFITQVFEDKTAKNIASLLRKIDETLTAFIQGQLLVSFILGILLFIGYWIADLNYALTLALFAMIMNVIPFLGPFLAVIPALIVAAFQGFMKVVWIAVITIIAQQIESNLISPSVMGRKLALHPLTVITVILAAGSIAGFIGILFAVPFYAVIKTIYVHFYHIYQEKRLTKKAQDV